MAGARTAPDIDTRRCSIGVDLGGPLLEVARRGFQSTFSNQMGQLGGWISSVPWSSDTDDLPVTGPAMTRVLHLADDLAGSLAAHEIDAFDVVRLGLAVPGWLGWCDRHHIARLVDPHDACQLVWVPSPMAVAVATNETTGAALHGNVVGGSSTLASEVVVAIDLDLGISASLIDIDGGSVREVAAVAAAPKASNRPDTVAAVIAELAGLARHVDAAAATRIVLAAAAGSASSAVRQAIGALGAHWADCSVDIVTSRSDIARATVMLADQHADEIVAVAPRSVGVLIDDIETGRSTFHAIVAKNTSLPSRWSATFDLGPDDGAEVYVELYEAQPDATAQHSERHAHRPIMTARLDASGLAQRPEAVDVTFVAGVDGLLRLEPAASDPRLAWSCSWATSSVVMPSATMSSVAGRSVAQLSRTLAAPASRASSAGRATRSMAPPVVLAEALGRAERSLSRQLGRLVAIRSAMALCGCSDGDDGAAVRTAAGRLLAALEVCPANDAARALRAALEATDRALDASSGRLYAGGTEREVTRDLGRVVEHLAVVIGTVTPAERNRLVMDAQLLGFDQARARSVVDQLIDDAGVDSDGSPDHLHDVSALVVVSADGFALVPIGTPVAPQHAAIRVMVFDA